MKQRDYDSTVARIAGNIASGLLMQGAAYYAMHTEEHRTIAEVSVSLARAIVEETCRTEPKEPPHEG